MGMRDSGVVHSSRRTVLHVGLPLEKYGSERKYKDVWCVYSYE